MRITLSGDLGHTLEESARWQSTDVDHAVKGGIVLLKFLQDEELKGHGFSVFDPSDNTIQPIYFGNNNFQLWEQEINNTNS